MATFLVETYAASGSAIDSLAVIARSAAAASRQCGGGVRYERTIFLPTEEMCFHLFEGASADAVAQALEGSSLSNSRIVVALTTTGRDRRTAAVETIEHEEV